VNPIPNPDPNPNQAPQMSLKEVCVFITAGPSTKMFTWGGGRIWEDKRRSLDRCALIGKPVCVEEEYV
jgi:hypothetical protein